MAGEDTPVSWYMIEAGWEVVDKDGQTVGRVEEVLGDSTHDIFDGLSIATSFLGKSRYIPAEQVAEITEGRLRLPLSRQEVEQLPEHLRPPTSAQIEPEQTSLAELEQPIVAPASARPEREPLLRRLVLRIRAWLRAR